MSFETLLNQSQTLIIITGPSLSAPYVLPSSLGLYHLIDLATPDAFLENPFRVWQYYTLKRHLALRARPSPAHYAILELFRRFKENGKRCLIVDQNDDGLLDRASRASGIDAGIIDLHGSLFELRCTDFFCLYVDKPNEENPLTPSLALVLRSRKRKHDALETDTTASSGSSSPLDAYNCLEDQTSISSTQSNKTDQSDLPRCPQCGGLLRPGVVWFGESILLNKINQIDDFFLQNKVDLILLVGVKSDLWPAMGYVERVKRNGGRIAIFDDSIDLESLKRLGDLGGPLNQFVKRLRGVIGSKFMPRGV